MDHHSLRVLEYAAIRRMVIEHAACGLGQERAEQMAPSTRPDEVARLQRETTEAVALLELPGAMTFGGIHDIRAATRIAAAGGTLEAAALIKIADTLGGVRRLKAPLTARRDASPLLHELGWRLSEFGGLEEEIRECVGPRGEVLDTASPLLGRLRRELRTFRARVSERLQSVLRSPQYRDMLQDPVITTRDGRFCLPVKSEYRTQFGGLVHDQSASGATVFMEPASVVELGNELRQLEARERHEIERILRELSGRLGERGEELLETLDVVGELDFIFARARLSLGMDGTEPLINRDGFVSLRRARHPLLHGNVVPLDLELGRAKWVIVVTGPNTGGKTVALKTVGLLALMAQSGLHLPAHEGSTVPVFEGIHADIGDEQSIQQSLSTFSGHITNIARILGAVEQTPGASLVLLDEVGAGTDPAEGAALARAILEYLRAHGVRTIATTHYGELKEFAYASEGVENASVEFDLQTLGPTYRLLTGVPGTSNAFAIAARLGLPVPVLEAAKGMIGAERTELSEVIQRLTEEQRATEEDLRRAATAVREVESARAQAALELKRAQAERADLINRARGEAEELLRATRREAELFRERLRELDREARRNPREGAKPGAIDRVREELNLLAREAADRTAALPPREPPPAPVGAAEEPPQLDSQAPTAGDLVWVPEFNQRGTLLSAPDAGKAQVQIGSMRLTVPAASLRRILSPARGRIGTPPAGPPGPVAPSLHAPSLDSRVKARMNISPELHLRGLRAEEALSRLDSYLDDACLAGLSPVRIVHGKGTGALKRAVWEHLQRHPQVAGYAHPGDDDGGSGVTLAELRE
jgi:DNA mismatch repair protein MutS2